MKVLYVDKTFNGLSLFDLLTRNPERYRNLLKSDLVVSIIEELWSGSTNLTFNFHQFTAISSYFDDFPEDLFSIHINFQPNLSVKSLFQLQSWKTNGNLRLLVESIALFAVFTIMVTSLVYYTRIIPVFENLTSSYEDIMSAQATLDSLTTLTTVYFSILSLFCMYTLQKTAYKWLLKESIRPSLRDLLDIALWADSFVILYSNLSPAIIEDIGNRQFFRLSEILFSMLFFLYSIRIIVILVQTKVFGPVVRMVYVIVKDVMAFLVLYGLLVFAFTVFFVPLFWRDTEYFGTIQVAFRTLLQWSVSGIDVSVFTYREELGSVLTVTWALMSTILALNILIAMLSSRYDELSPQITSDYVSILYYSYQQTRYQAPYGSLVMAPPPFNFTHLCLIPLYLVWPHTAKRLDTVFVVISYQVLFTIGGLLFIGYNLLLGCAAYFWVLWKVKGRCKVMMQWVFCGPAYLLYVEIGALKCFARSMYTVAPTEQGDQLPDDVFFPCLHYLESLCVSPSDLVLPFHDVVAVLTKLPVSRPLDISAPAKLSGWTFSTVARRLYGIKTTLTKSKIRQILEFFEQFKSPSASGSSPDTINLTRMLRLLTSHKSNPRPLISLNLYFTLTALDSL